MTGERSTERDVSTWTEELDRALNRKPVVIVSAYDRWLRYLTIMLISVAIALLIAVIVRFTDLGQELLINRAVMCRGLIVDGVELAPRGPCMDDAMLELYDPATGIPR